MRAVKKEVNERGHIILSCEETFLFGLFKLNKQFMATKEYPKGYWNWRKLPNKTTVGTMMSFQLDGWYEDFD